MDSILVKEIRCPDSITSTINARLTQLGISLPAPPAPVGAYRRIVVRNGIGFISGQFPLVDGKLVYAGCVGAELTEDEGRLAARIAAVNVLAQIHSHLGGFEGFAGLLRIEGYVASAAGNFSQPEVLDGASDLLVAVLGPELGAHARTAFSVTQLPLGAPVELAVSFAMAAT